MHRALKGGVAFLTVMFLLCSMPSAPQAQEAAAAKIADIQGFTGKVVIKTAAGEAKSPTIVAKRVRGGSLFNNDTLSTEAGATGEILFLDGSKLNLQEKASIQIEEKKLAKPTAKGQTVGRRIKVLVGKVVSEVQPSKDIVTEFETPAGVAAVRGTVLTIGWVNGEMTASVDQGTVELRPRRVAGGFIATLSDGSEVMIKRDAGGRTHFKVLNAGSSGKVDVKFGKATIKMDKGDQIGVIASNMSGMAEYDDVNCEAGTCEVTGEGGITSTLSEGDSTALVTDTYFQPGSESFDIGSYDTGGFDFGSDPTDLSTQ